MFKTQLLLSILHSNLLLIVGRTFSQGFTNKVTCSFVQWMNGIQNCNVVISYNQHYAMVYQLNYTYSNM
jgi:hypothetical protein